MRSLDTALVHCYGLLDSHSLHFVYPPRPLAIAACGCWWVGGGGCVCVGCGAVVCVQREVVCEKGEEKVEGSTVDVSFPVSVVVKK